MQTIIATYFDGLSSVPHEIELVYDEQNHEFCFQTQNSDKIVWTVDDIHFEKLDTRLEIRHVNDPVAQIKISNPEQINNILQHFKKKGKIGWYHQLVYANIKTHIGIALLILAIIAAGYFYAIPWIAEKAITLVPTSFDKYLGNEFMLEYLTKNAIDSDKTKQLNAFAQNIDFENKEKLAFTVVESETVNAFALPNGQVVVFSGLLDKMNGYDELAGLLGHEVAHINNRHSLKMLARNLAGYIFISAMLSDVNGIMAVIADNAHNLQSLSYSRTFETEADEQGTQILIRNSINPEGMLKLFSRLKKEDDLISIPEFMSSHPVTDERMKNIKQYISEQKFSNKKHAELEKIFRAIKKSN